MFKENGDLSLMLRFFKTIQKNYPDKAHGMVLIPVLSALAKEGMVDQVIF